MVVVPIIVLSILSILTRGWTSGQVEMVTVKSIWFLRRVLLIASLAEAGLEGSLWAQICQGHIPALVYKVYRLMMRWYLVYLGLLKKRDDFYFGRPSSERGVAECESEFRPALFCPLLRCS